MDALTPEPLTEERCRRIESAFHAAVALPEPARGKRLHELCGADLALVAEVQQMLNAFDQEAQGQPAAPPERLAEPAGKRFGNYELLRLLGFGGMGSVYLAHRADGEFDQLAAVKVLGVNLRTEFFTDRFRFERQILANLDHPNITRLLDGGVSSDGDPYLVMELVDGTPIDTYCERRASSIPDRVRLFLQVCSAVEYAHRNLVVHRDLKPGNIFVTEAGVVKLLDFGTAKLLAIAESDGRDHDALPDAHAAVCQSGAVAR